MINLPTIGPVRTPTENNPVKKVEQARRVDELTEASATATRGFVERRKNPDRRRQSKRTPLDTRQRKDRRRTSNIDINV